MVAGPEIVRIFAEFESFWIPFDFVNEVIIIIIICIIIFLVNPRRYMSSIENLMLLLDERRSHKTGVKMELL